MPSVTQLHLDAGARRAVADSWRSSRPGGRYPHRDLALTPVPQIGEAWTELGDHVLAHRLTGIARAAEAMRTAAWAIVGPLLDELVAADTARGIGGER
ncbi:hypothetical protein GCM10010168_79190 [Actinoplanes ianthinogenes]|uniref:Uncharacterized protein n=1 Tax=Actinoplanes ianthinogenes TaxID=122358 RepID=A0ABM7LK42_9ACTN|nr:hypothetical protein [Actinoplanes ianthinogenes]BCJ39626.1 hypothetical protein Aiant_02830 [Actinoplanes ianthinogenes]GGR48473.1 hypothetical protein GCM10010168_79190 [Actinoplanes ianthinogenes]